MRLVAVLWLSLAASCALAADAPVVIELFSSQGCSSCPPAEELLAKLANESGVIALGFHVDYWNKQGWVDPYSNPAWSQRQGAYSAVFDADNIYTPQLVVDGRAEALGSDEKSARALIAAARKLPWSVDVALAPTSGNTRTASVSVTVTLPEDEPGPFYLCTALTEDGLATNVKAGENAGQTMLGERVVRLMDRVEIKESGPRPASFALHPGWKRDRLRATALVQDRRMRVLGAAQVRLAP